MKPTKLSFIILITILNPCFFIGLIFADTLGDIKTNADNISANKKAISDNVKLTDRNWKNIRDNRNAIIRDMNDMRSVQLTTKKIVDSSRYAITALQAGHTALENQIQNNKNIAINAEKDAKSALDQFPAMKKTVQLNHVVASEAENDAKKALDLLASMKTTHENRLLIMTPS